MFRQPIFRERRAGIIVNVDVSQEYSGLVSKFGRGSIPWVEGSRGPLVPRARLKLFFNLKHKSVRMLCPCAVYV